jgi:taurine-pyruvate aminotransferase
MAITEEEGLLENSSRMGDYLHEKLLELQDKHPCIGDVRGIGLFQGAELVADRETREPLDEKKVQAIVADCMAQGVIIGASNRSMPGFNNTLLFAPALIAKADDLDEVVAGVDAAITRVVG